MLTHIRPASLVFTFKLRSNLTVTSAPGSVSRLDHDPSSAQSPFAHSRCYLPWCGILLHIKERYLSFIAHMNSCARPKPSCIFRSLIMQVFAGCCQSLLGDGPSRRYLCNPWMSAWTPTPPRLFGAFSRFFPKSVGLSILLTTSARENIPGSNFARGSYFGAAVISLCSGSHPR